MRCSNDGESFEEVFTCKFFGCPHINEVDFSFWINDWVLRFYVSVDYIVRVKILDRDKKACKIVFDHFWGHRFNLTDYIKHFFSMDVFQKKVDVFIVLKGFDESNNIRKYCFLKNFFLLDYWLFHFLPFNVLFW